MSHMSPQDTPRHLPTGPPPDGSPLRARATPTSARYASAASPSAAAPSPSRVPPLPKTGLAALVERFGSIQVEIDGNLLNLHLAPFGLLVCGSAACFSHMEPAPAEAQISPPAQVTTPATAGLPCRLWLDRPARQLTLELNGPHSTARSEA